MSGGTGLKNMFHRTSAPHHQTPHLITFLPFKYKPFLKGVRLAGQITALASAVAILYELSGGPISFVAATAAAFAIPRPILNAGRAVASAGGNTAVLLASSEARHKSIDNFKEAKEKVRVYKNKTEPLLVSSVPEEEIEMFSIEKKIK